VSENKVLMIFGPKRDEVVGGWRELQNEELRDNTLLQVKLELSSRGEWDGCCI
jgi:hypothetical protein